jgi:hypothetical protein
MQAIIGLVTELSRLYVAVMAPMLQSAPIYTHLTRRSRVFQKRMVAELCKKSRSFTDLWIRDLHYRVHKSLPLDSVLSQINSGPRPYTLNPRGHFYHNLPIFANICSVISGLSRFVAIFAADSNSHVGSCVRST